MARAALIGVLVSICGSLTASCGPKNHRHSAPAKPALVVLLPDPESGQTGRARATNEYGSAELAAPRDAVNVRSDAKPGPAKQLDEAEVSRIFGSALAALPALPQHFTLQFSFESDELTEQSRALFPDILAAVKARAYPEVAIVGHTDTMGDARTNVALGMKRAISIRRLLVDAGVNDSIIEVSSHGEKDLLVKTRNNTAEPRNRRVEIVVR
jgi:peptidoglycan-associated lipoprotein